MTLTRDPARSSPARLVSAGDDSVRASGKTVSDLEIPDPLAQAADVAYRLRLICLLGELESNLCRFAAPASVQELPAQLAFTCGWVTRLSDVLYECVPTEGCEAAVAAGQYLATAGELLEKPAGWTTLFGLVGTAKRISSSQRIRAIKAAADVIEQLFVALGVGFRSPDQAAEWVGTVGLLARELRRRLAWANSNPK